MSDIYSINKRDVRDNEDWFRWMKKLYERKILAESIVDGNPYQAFEHYIEAVIPELAKWSNHRKTLGWQRCEIAIKFKDHTVTTLKSKTKLGGLFRDTDHHEMAETLNNMDKWYTDCRTDLELGKYDYVRALVPHAYHCFSERNLITNPLNNTFHTDYIEYLLVGGQCIMSLIDQNGKYFGVKDSMYIYIYIYISLHSMYIYIQIVNVYKHTFNTNGAYIYIYIYIYNRQSGLYIVI